MTKKILLSVAASALLTTSAFAGTLSFSQDHTQYSTESHMQNGLDEINATTLVYTPTFNIQDRPSGLIPEASIQLDISDIEFPLTFLNQVLGSDYDATGKGVAATSLTKDELDTIFSGTAWQDTSAGDTFGDQFEFHHTHTSGPVVLLNFSGQNTLYKNHTYIFVDDDTTPNELSFKFNALSGAKLKINTFHPDIDTEAIDDAEVEFEATLVPQFNVACVRKFDGLINFENDRVSFVNPEHGERIGNVPADTNNDTLITSDRMIFTIDNARANNTVRWMGGHATQFSFTADNNNNAFEAWTNSTVKIYHTQANPDNVDTDATAVPPSFAPIILAPGTRDTVLPSALGTFVYEAATKRFTVTYPNEELKIGLTTFVVDLLKPADQLPLRAVTFVPAGADMEAGLNLADDTRSDIVQNGHPTGPDHFVLNNEDDSGVILPQNQTDIIPTDAGEWMDHSYIAQIAGATDGTDVKSKVFIVNRSCAPVRPTFKLIREGKVSEYKANAAIAVDSQVVAKLGTIKDQTGYTLVSGPDLKDVNGLYAVEVILPGIAEDFYVYAQALHLTKGQFKDLPVYNTSNRD